jgi:hypothetical protein
MGACRAPRPVVPPKTAGHYVTMSRPGAGESRTVQGWAPMSAGRRAWLRGAAAAVWTARGASSWAAATPLPLPAAGQWLELPDTSARKVTPARDGHPGWGVIGPRAVTDAWGGAAFDTQRNVMVLTGGGHGDYGGNEVYEFHLPSMTWTRTTDPSPMRELGDGNYEVIGSEAPVSSHSYDGLVYLRSAGAVFKFGGAGYRSGAAYDSYAYLYLTASRSWRRLERAPRHVLQVAADLDPRSGRVVIGTGSGLMWFDSAGGRWELGPQGNSNISVSGAVCDTHGHRFVQMQTKTGALDYFDLADPSRRRTTPIKGVQEWERKAGMVYEAGRDRIVIWGGGAEVWLVRPDDWSVTKLVPTGAPVPSITFPDGRRRSAGIYSRWQYVPEHDVFIGYPSFEGNVWLYRLPH